MAVPRLFDDHRLRLHLSRAIRRGYAGFLVEALAGELADRLATLTRRFPLALDAGAPIAAVSAALAAGGRVDRVVRAALLPEPDTAVFDGVALPFAPTSFDLIVSIFALHAVNDLPGALVQIRAALKPDGLFIGCLMAGESLIELRQSFLSAESDTAGGAAARVAPMADLRDLGALLQRAGFALPVADMERTVVRHADPLGLIADLRGMGLTNPLAGRVPLLSRTALALALDNYRRRFTDADGRSRATFDIAWLSGWAPHASQQQPLAPGSAKTRLAEALGTIEHKAGEVAGKVAKRNLTADKSR
jgi:SAM-dependent methyltransferase